MISLRKYRESGLLTQEMEDRISNTQIKMIISNVQACTLDVIPEGIGRFGLDESNPIPVAGISSNEVYLKKLRARNGNAISWRRKGSLIVPNIEKPVDHYQIFDYKGDFLTECYISPYHWRTSKKAPDGFYRC